MISHYGTADAALEAIPELAKRGGAAARITIFSREDAERELETVERIGARFVGMGEPDFPANLRALDTCPPLLCIRGSNLAFNEKSLAVVGSRNASIAGLKIAENMARQIGNSDYKIVSGLARGIDTKAHQSALKTGTVAVFAGGVDVVFPEENQELAAEILANDGAIVSEMPVGGIRGQKIFPGGTELLPVYPLLSW